MLNNSHDTHIFLLMGWEGEFEGNGRIRTGNSHFQSRRTNNIFLNRTYGIKAKERESLLVVRSCFLFVLLIKHIDHQKEEVELVAFHVYYVQ